jgi:predicted NBD/HSP70 family sugar kinase
MYAAVDVGGTKTLVAVFAENGEIKEQLKFATPKDYTDFVKELAANVDNLSTKDFRGAAVAVPGRIHRRTGVGIAFGNLPWINVPIQDDAEKVLGCPVVIENDAKLAALSEALLIKDTYHKILYITISTGIGAGMIIDGKISPYFRDMEVGHVLLEHGDRLVRWEDFASGSAIVEKFGKRASEITDTQDWYVIARNIAIGLIDLIATLTPEVIVIGGGVGTHFDKYKDRLIEQLKIYENPMVTIPPIIKAQRAEEAVVYGCYEHAKDHFGRRR